MSGRAVARWLANGLYRASTIGMAKGPHLTRYSMYQRPGRVFASIPLQGKCLSISHSAELCSVLGIRPAQIVEANYPEYNMLHLPFEDGAFDCVVSDQVLEHVEGDPRKAIEESIRVTKPGGYVVHTTCLLNPVHNFPADYWRFTPEGLELLAKGLGRVVERGGWGNPWLPLALLFDMRHLPVPEPSWHPVHRLATMNRGAYACVVWIVLRKETDDRLSAAVLSGRMQS